MTTYSPNVKIRIKNCNKKHQKWKDFRMVGAGLHLAVHPGSRDDELTTTLKYRISKRIFGI
jgi:hypothetical protein